MKFSQVESLPEVCFGTDGFGARREEKCGWPTHYGIACGKREELARCQIFGGVPPGQRFVRGVAAEGFAAVDPDQVAVGVARVIGCEKDGEFGDVVDLAPPLEGKMR